MIVYSGGDGNAKVGPSSRPLCSMTVPMTFDAALIARYERNGPRYTSYPTSAQFSSGFGDYAYRQAALISNADPATPLSLYVHIPFCASPCFYCGCAKVVTRDVNQASAYLERLKREIVMQSRLFDARRPVRQLHFGGGTPTFFSIEQLRELLDVLADRFHLDASTIHDFAIELDPRTVRDDTLPLLRAAGFNRLSLGIQDFAPQVQAAIHRRQSIDQIASIMEQARSLGFSSVNFDLIYGLPLQTFESFTETLKQVLWLRPDRIAAYGYAHLPKLFKAQRAIRESDLPDASLRLGLLQLTVESLAGGGYEYIGMDHFALPHDELAQAHHRGGLHRNFQGYSTLPDCDLVGLGMSAIGKLGNVYSQNQRRLDTYSRAVDNGMPPIERGVALNMDDVVRRDIIQLVMCGREVRFDDIERRYALQFSKYFAYELCQLKTLADDGLIALSPNGFHVTPVGRFLLRNIAMTFDIYLRSDAARRFSRTI